MKNRITLIITFLIMLLFSSCGFTIDDLLFDYNAKFDQTPIKKFISNGKINPEAIIQEDIYEIKKDVEGGKNLIISAPYECDSFEWTISPNICIEHNIPTDFQTFVIPIDLLDEGEYTVNVMVFYKSEGYQDSCIVRIY